MDLPPNECSLPIVSENVNSCYLRLHETNKNQLDFYTHVIEKSCGNQVSNIIQDDLFKSILLVFNFYNKIK